LAILEDYSIQQLSEILPDSGSLVALDTETNAKDPGCKDFKLIGIGLSTDQGPIYLDVQNINTETKAYLVTKLQSYKLIAHNVVFDAAVMLQWTDGEPMTWTYCTYGLYKQIATEGYPGQRWGLKHAMTDVLGWESTNEEKLDSWLIDNGYAKRNGRADKSMMYLAPASILGYYCALDADACLQLYEILYDQVLIKPKFRDLDIYHTDIFIPNAILIAQQWLYGISIDQEQLISHKESLEDSLIQIRNTFVELPQVEPHIQEYNEVLYAQYQTNFPNGRLTKDNPKFQFNIQSKPQLEWLLFDRLGYDPVKYTEGGRRAVDKKSLPAFGEIGRLLMEYNKVVKELGYIRSCLTLSSEGDILYPRINYPGTVTGRCSGGGKGD